MAVLLAKTLLEAVREGPKEVLVVGELHMQAFNWVDGPNLVRDSVFESFHLVEFALPCFGGFGKVRLIVDDNLARASLGLVSSVRS